MIKIDVITARVYRWLFSAAAITSLTYFLPLFHLAPLQATRDNAEKVNFNANSYVETLWHTLQNSAGSAAVDVKELAQALQQGQGLAEKRYGRKLGLGSNASYFIFGTGEIVSVDNDSVVINLPEENAGEVVIEVGPVFSNAIRDGSGLLNVSDFSNTQDFNAISSEINRRVETEVFPVLQENAKPGEIVSYIGGAEVANMGHIDSSAPISLMLIPVLIEFQ